MRALGSLERGPRSVPVRGCRAMQGGFLGIQGISDLSIFLQQVEKDKACLKRFGLSMSVPAPLNVALCQGLMASGTMVSWGYLNGVVGGCWSRETPKFLFKQLSPKAPRTHVSRFLGPKGHIMYGCWAI